MPDVKPVGTLTPIAPKPVGELKPLNSASETDKAYLDALNHRNDPNTKKIATVWSDKEETSTASDLYQSLARGSDRLGSMLAKTPAMVYDLAAEATDALVNTANKGINYIAGTNLKTDYQTTSENFAKELGLGENKVAKYYDERVKRSQEVAAQKYDKEITDYFAKGEFGKGFGLIANSVAESAPTTIALLMGNAAGVSATASTLGGGVVFAADKKAELDEKAPNLDHDTKMSIAMANGLFEGFFEQYGITKLAGLTKEVLNREGKEAAKKIAEEGFKEVYKPVAKKYLGVAAEESIGEAATQFAQNAVDKYSGYKPDMDILEGVVDAGIVGLAASGGFSALPSAMDARQRRKANKEGKELLDEKASAKEKADAEKLKQDEARIKKDAERNRFALDLAQKGEESVRAFKENVNKQVEAGTMTPEEATNAITRVNSYKEYNDIVGALELPEEKKLEVFDKTYQKQTLESELREMGEPSKLHPLKQSEYKIKEKFANDLQKDIDGILMDAQVKNETTVATKTIEELAKKEEKAKEPAKPGEKKTKLTGVLKAFDDKYKEKIPKETRKIEDIPNEEFNGNYNARKKNQVVSEFLERQPGQKIYGKLVERPFKWKKKESSVLGIEMPGGKITRFASSMERIFEDKEGGEGMRGHTMEERLKQPVGLGMKVYNVTDENGESHPHVKVFRQTDGKFIAWLKKTNTGSSNLDPVEKEQVEHLETVDEVDDTQSLTTTQPVPDIPVKNLEKVKTNTTLAKDGKDANNRKGPGTGSDQNTSGESSQAVPRKETTLRTGTKKRFRKIKDPEMKLALRADVFTPYDLTIQSFINGTQVNTKDLKKFFKNTSTLGYSKTEISKRLQYHRVNGKTIDQIAHDLQEEHADLGIDIRDWRDAVDDVITNFHSTKSMAQDLNKRANKVDPSQFTESEKELGEALDKIDYDRIAADVENVIDVFEGMTAEELTKLANSTQEEFREWEKGQDIIKDDGQGPVFQKQSATVSETENIEKVLDVIRKNFPKVDVVYDDTIKGSGQLDGNTIRVNPYLAGTDTPIHEAAHVFLDAMENSPLYKDAVSQLKDTPLWDEVAQNYDKLNEHQLANEVLAEAIGREGSGIFDEVAAQSKFKQTLERIFDWLKQKLGLEKNIAKALAKQIISGIGTKDLSGKAGEVKNQNNKDFMFFRAKHLKRNVDRENDILEAINTMLEEDISQEERNEIQETKKAILDERKEDKAEYAEYKKEMDKIKRIEMAKDLENIPLNDLIDAYNQTRFYSDTLDRQTLEEIKNKLAFYLSNQGRERLKKHAAFKESDADKKDLDWLDVWTKTLSQMGQNVPELQELSKVFDKTYLEMKQDRIAKKKQLKKYADAVIKEKNKTLGIREKAAGLLFSDNAKYFEFMDDGTGHFVSGEGLTKAQKDFLDYIKEITKERQLVDEDGNILENEVIKINPEFNEKYKGWIEKVLGFLKIPVEAYREQKESHKSAYDSVYNGRLTNKFNKSRPKDKGYSKNFYHAAELFIDDYTHVKHMSKMVSLVDSIAMLNQRGYGEQMKKPNVVKWLYEWSQEQIYKAPKTTTPGVDLTLKALRRLTSMIIMGFNIPASIMNVFIGNYNNWRKDAAGLGYIGFKSGYVGNKRLLSKKGYAILQEYDVIDSDFDSNPKAFAGRLFDMLAYGAQRYGEMQIQGSMFLSQLNDDEWKSFEYKNGELKLKEGVNADAIKEAFSNYKNKVSDVQGKYSEKDRRNFMRGEFFKAVAQFKVWIPDYMKERFGEEYIDRNNEVHKGSFNGFVKQALKDIKADWNDKKLDKILKNKQVAQNLKGALFVAGLLIIKYSGDDDDDKKRKVLSAENAIGNLMFIFDPESLQYTIDNPIAVKGIVSSFLKTLSALIKLDTKTAGKEALNLVPYKKIVKPLIEEKAEDIPKKILLGI